VTYSLNPVRRSPLVALSGGILALLVVMGIGRFAYTLLLPLMQEKFGFGLRAAGWLASANYLGYFVGSLAATAWPLRRATRPTLLAAFIASTLTSLGMGLTGSLVVWLALRFVSGIASAWVFVIVSALVLTELRQANLDRLTGWIYGGVGVGIALTATLALVLPVRDAAQLWILFGAISGLLLAAAAPLLPARQAISPPNTGGSRYAVEQAGRGRGLLLFAYCLEGVGYVVSATFIVAIVHTAQGGFESGAWVWIIVGLAGIPACVLWTRHADYRKSLNRLATAYWIQAAGIVAVAVAPHSVGAALASAATLGATLVGVVMLTIGLVPGIDPENPRRVVGQLTIGFSLGQMMGPVLAGYAADYFGNFRVSLLSSALLIVMSALATHAMNARADPKASTEEASGT
jgi:predicted MFS family arabinose efflux permease